MDNYERTNKYKGNKIDINSIKNPEGEITSESSQMAEVFAIFFSKEGENLSL